MEYHSQTRPTLRLREPETVMRLARLGSFHQCRLSFMRVLLRRLAGEAWRFSRPVFEIDQQGIGHAVYTATGPERSYSLVAFAHDLPADQRSDRVIAEAWDATFALFDGVPQPEDIERLSQNVPLQEAGRVSERELSLSRANRSVRLWSHVVETLATGRQPDAAEIDAVGYLMRTTAVYGSGKFGAADREMIATRPEFAGPFQVEMLAVFLIRAFVRDLVEHMAAARAPDTAVPLDDALARRVGIGNSTGLGMAPFLVNHPILLNNWIAAREEALARVRAVACAAPQEAALFRDLLARSGAMVAVWCSDHPTQQRKLTDLRADLQALDAHLVDFDFTAAAPWDRLYDWAEGTLSPEGQELLASLLLEPYSALVDDLAAGMAEPVSETAPGFRIDGTMALGHIAKLLREIYPWALDTDWTAPENQARAWYVSEEKLEPRLGERFEEPIADYEQPLAPGRDAAALAAALTAWPKETPVAKFLLRHPEHRHTVRRVQLVAQAPYAEIRDNTIGYDLMPIDMLRCKLSFFGAQHFDPRSDRWVRICMYRGAPYPHEMAAHDDFWIYADGGHELLAQ
ncbi:MAG: hypothetical protein AAF415_20515 [Pseudomonadota bacterium]